MIEFLLWFVACVFSTFGFTFFYIKITNASHVLRFKIIFIFLIGVILETLIKFYDVTSLSIISYFIFYPYLFYVIQPSKFSQILYYLITIWVVGLLFDFFIMIVISFLSGFLNFDVYSYWFKLIPTMIICFLFCLSSYFSFFKKTINKLYSILNKIKFADFSLFFFSLFVLIVCIILAFNIRKPNILFMLVILLLLIVLSFYLLVKAKYNAIENRIFLEMLKQNNNFYIEMADEYSVFKHNLMAKLLSVKSVANFKAGFLVDDLIKEFNSSIDYDIKIREIPYGLIGIINQKLSPYVDILDIKINNSINFDIFDVLSPKKYNVLVEKISILIDNSLEACVNSMDKILIINIYSEVNGIFVEIKNTFSGTLNVEKIGTKHYSTKGEKRGLGLYSVLRNNVVDVKMKVINDYFETVISSKFDDINM